MSEGLVHYFGNLLMAAFRNQLMTSTYKQEPECLLLITYIFCCLFLSCLQVFTGRAFRSHFSTLLTNLTSHLYITARSEEWARHSLKQAIVWHLLLWAEGAWVDPPCKRREIDYRFHSTHGPQDQQASATQAWVMSYLSPGLNCWLKPIDRRSTVNRGQWAHHQPQRTGMGKANIKQNSVFKENRWPRRMPGPFCFILPFPFLFRLVAAVTVIWSA